MIPVSNNIYVPMNNPVLLRSNPQPYQAALLQREQDEQLRRLRSCRPVGPVEIAIDDRHLINFASNDYLGLSQHPFLKERAIEYVEKYGVGAPASRLLSGNLDCYQEIETKLARLKGKKAALLFASGFQANVTLIAALAGKESVLAADRLNHRSLLEGMQLSGARWFRYQHNDLSDLTARFQRPEWESKPWRWIVTESIFSMDGDCVDVEGLCATAAATQSQIYIDEAHATGVAGKNGMGLAAGVDAVDLSMGTFGKGFGVFGAYVACSQVMKDYLINFCSGLIYSTALPPSVLGAIDAALDLVPGMESERHKLRKLSQFLRDEAARLGFDTAGSQSQIVPLVVGSETKARELAEYLEEKGFYAPAIRPPTVAAGASRVRVSLSAQHSEAQVEALVAALLKWKQTQ